jgi:GAF domain-containing protein
VTGATPEEDPSLQGRICYEPMRLRTDDVFLVHNLQETDYALTDPAVKREDLHTYMGKSVRVGSHCAGALCVAYQEEFLPSEEDQQILILIATLIGLEEARRRAEERLRHQQRVAQGLFQTMLSREDRVVTLKEEVNDLRKELGLRAKYGASVDGVELARKD